MYKNKIITSESALQGVHSVPHDQPLTTTTYKWVTTTLSVPHRPLDVTWSDNNVSEWWAEYNYLSIIKSAHRHFGPITKRFHITKMTGHNTGTFKQIPPRVLAWNHTSPPLPPPYNKKRNPRVKTLHKTTYRHKLTTEPSDYGDSPSMHKYTKLPWIQQTQQYKWNHVFSPL